MRDLLLLMTSFGPGFRPHPRHVKNSLPCDCKITLPRTGDVIDFTATYLGLPVREAAEKLAKDFGVRYEVQRPPDRGKCKKNVTTASLEQNYGKLERICFSILGQYREQLQFWKELYAPKRPDEEWDSRFCEALDRLTRVEYLMDVLLYSL